METICVVTIPTDSGEVKIAGDAKALYSFCLDVAITYGEAHFSWEKDELNALAKSAWETRLHFVDAADKLKNMYEAEKG